MAWFKREEVKGFWIDRELVCPDCILPAEIEGLNMGEILSSDGIDEEDYYFCDRCEERIS